MGEARKWNVGGSRLTPRRRLGAAVVFALALWAIEIPAAQAAFPGVDGRIAYEDGGTIYSVNPDGSGRAALARGSEPTWSPDGSRIAFQRDDSSGAAQVWTMDANGGDQREVTEGSEPAWSPDGERLAYVGPHSAIGRDSGAIWVVDGDGGNPTVVAAPPCSGEHCFDLAPWYGSPAWSPDGREIAFLDALR
jgi:Tol biopolymer transport system component